MNKTNLLVASVLGLGICGNVAAYDNVERDVSAYSPQGIHTGGFTVFPQLRINNEYDSNIFRQDSRLGATDSYVAHFSPGFDIKSNWSSHALNFSFDSDLTQYSSLPDQTNYQDIFTTLGGKLDVLRDSYMDAAFSFNSVHENRGSPDQIGGRTPTFYDATDIQWFYTHKFNRVSLKGGLDATRYDYQDTPTSTPVVLLMSTRNHWQYMPSIRLGYEIQPGYEAFVKVVYNNEAYDTLVRSNGIGTAFQRDSEGYNVLGGMAFDVTHLITGDISIGYLSRSYNGSNLKNNISGVNGFVDLKWHPTTLTTVVATVSHNITETTQFGVGGALSTSVGLSVEHELLRNVLLRAGGSYAQNEYQGFDPNSVILQNRQNRQDNIYGGNIGVKYLVNRNLSTDLSYRYQSRDVNYQFVNFEVNQVMLNIIGQF